MSESDMPYGSRFQREQSNDDFDLSSLRTAETVDKKRSHLSAARAHELLDNFFLQAGLTSRSEKSQWLATLVRYLWENGTSPHARYQPEQWGNVVAPLTDLIKLSMGESMRQFGRSSVINTAAYYVGENPANRPWIMAHARAKGVSEINAFVAFDFYDRSTFPVSHGDTTGEIDRSAQRALRGSAGPTPTVAERAEGSQAHLVPRDEHTF